MPWPGLVPFWAVFLSNHSSLTAAVTKWNFRNSHVFLLGHRETIIGRQEDVHEIVQVLSTCPCLFKRMRLAVPHLPASLNSAWERRLRPEEPRVLAGPVALQPRCPVNPSTVAWAARPPVPFIKIKSILENNTIMRLGSFFLVTCAALSFSPSWVIKMSCYVVNMAAAREIFIATRRPAKADGLLLPQDRNGPFAPGPGEGNGDSLEMCCSCGSVFQTRSCVCVCMVSKRNTPGTRVLPLSHHHVVPPSDCHSPALRERAGSGCAPGGGANSPARLPAGHGEPTHDRRTCGSQTEVRRQGCDFRGIEPARA